MRVFALLLIPVSVLAVGVDGQRLDGTIDFEAQRVSRSAKVTILRCGQGRMRGLVNWQNKCASRGRQRFRRYTIRNSEIRSKKGADPVLKIRNNAGLSLRQRVKQILALKRSR